MHWLVWVVLAAISWGVYGPVLFKGTALLGHSSMRALICVGVAYFVLAIIIPTLWLNTRGEKGQFTTGGITWAGLCGVAGALGAVFVIFALTSLRANAPQVSPLLVMSLVFTGAPVINAFASMVLTPPKPGTTIDPRFYLGILLAAVSAGLVLNFKPKPAPPTPAHPTSAEHVAVQAAAGASPLDPFPGDGGHARRADG